MSPKYSQVFLKNNSIAQKIADIFTSIAKENEILEIGPGKGILTQFLYPKYREKYIAVEIDPSMVEILVKKFEGIKIINKDFLKLKEDEITQSYICGNLPYHISTAILEKIINLKNFKASIFMFQKEVAKKIVATPKDKEYGYLSALINIVAETEYLFDVSKHNFEPVPQVDSAVVKIEIKNERLNKELFKRYQRFISKAFMHKRKTILNSLALSTDIEKEKIIEILKKTNTPLLKRAEELSPDELLEISKNFNLS